VRPDEPRLIAAVEAATGRRPRRLTPLSGGCIAEVLKVELDGGGALVAKVAPEGGLEVEAAMLAYLAAESDLPVPAVRHAEDSLLLMDFIETSGALDARAERHAADLLAALHGITAPGFGFDRDTLIGPLPQANPWHDDWPDFFRDARLMPLGHLAHERGRLPAETLARLESVCARLDSVLDHGPVPSLVHGDMWGGNVLVRDGRIAAFVDPAIYYADAEVELAFSTLFGTFGAAFFERYAEHQPIAPGFFETRRDVYNLYPLLVHAALFGASYPAAVARILARFG
jgi:fructosamine-3-kinase